MPDPSSQQFLRDLDKSRAERDRLLKAARRGGTELPINRRSAADRLRANLDAAVYKHAVLGLIFLKYVSDSFAVRQAEIGKQLRDPQSEYFLDPADYKSAADYAETIREELEVRDYYIERNVFWVPALARWKTVQDSAKLPPGTQIEIAGERGRPACTDGRPARRSTGTYTISSTGRLIDDALEAIERENPSRAERDRLPHAARRVHAACINRKNVLNKDYVRLQIDPANLASLIDLIATIPFEHADLHAKDILGHVYEYFLGQFAMAEGPPNKMRATERSEIDCAKHSPKGERCARQYFTPKSIVSLIVETVEPYQGRIYDPACGSGGFFVQSESRSEAETASRRLPGRRVKRGNFVEERGGKLGNLSVYGQDKSARGQRRFGLAQRALRVRMPGRHPKQSNPTTWRLAAMNMAIHGIDFTAVRGIANSKRKATLQSVSEAKDHFGKEPANTASRGSAMVQREASLQVVSEAKDNFTNDQLPDLRADYVMATAKRASATFRAKPDRRSCRRQDHPTPFKVSEWRDAKLEGDVRWKYGTPPKGEDKTVIVSVEA